MPYSALRPTSKPGRPPCVAKQVYCIERGPDRKFRRESIFCGAAYCTKGKGVVRNCDRHHVAEYQQGGDPGDDALATGFAAREGKGAEDDIEDQRTELGGEA